MVRKMSWNLEICLELLSLDSLAMPFLYHRSIRVSPNHAKPSSRKDEASGREAVHYYVLSIDTSRSRQFDSFSDSDSDFSQTHPLGHEYIAPSSYARYVIDQSDSCFCRVSYELGTDVFD